MSNQGCDDVWSQFNEWLFQTHGFSTLKAPLPMKEGNVPTFGSRGLIRPLPVLITTVSSTASQTQPAPAAEAKGSRRPSPLNKLDQRSTWISPLPHLSMFKPVPWMVRTLVKAAEQKKISDSAGKVQKWQEIKSKLLLPGTSSMFKTNDRLFLYEICSK